MQVLERPSQVAHPGLPLDLHAFLGTWLIGLPFEEAMWVSQDRLG